MLHYNHTKPTESRKCNTLLQTNSQTYHMTGNNNSESSDYRQSTSQSINSCNFVAVFYVNSKLEVTINFGELISSLWLNIFTGKRSSIAADSDLHEIVHCTSLRTRNIRKICQKKFRHQLHLTEEQNVVFSSFRTAAAFVAGVTRKKARK